VGQPPYPAYQQILKGLPAVDYKADELYYLPRNVRSHRVYGYSPVEQVVMTVNIALRRQMHQLQYYTEGNVPEALIGVPETWTPDQIGQFQAYWDALLEGDSAQRRHARFVPATISKSFVQTKEAGLKDDYDEWLARIVCFAFSISPQALVKAMNRATAETAHDQALQEGLLPLMRWVKELVDRALREGFGWGDLEFAWQEANEVDPLTQAKIAQVYLAAGVLTAAEVRASLGLGAEGKGGAANAGRPFGKYSEDQPRDDHGRWTSGDDAGVDDGKLGGGNKIEGNMPPPLPRASDNKPTEKMQQAVAGVNPENGHDNCVQIATAVVARLNGSNVDAYAENGPMIGVHDAEKIFDVDMNVAKGGIQGVYDWVKNSGDGATALMTVMVKDEDGNLVGHIVTVYNDHGVVGFLEGQDWGDGVGVLTNAKSAIRRYDMGPKTVVRIGKLVPRR